MHMKLVEASVIVFPSNHDFPCHVYFVSVNQYYWTCNPDIGVGTVFNGKVRTNDPKSGRRWMMSSASQTFL